jgi:hypothetical protein
VPALAYDLLDGPLAFLTLDVHDVLAPATVTSPDGRALPVYADPSEAEAQLARLPADADAALVVRRIEPNDVRAKEELLLAGRALGATRVAFDPRPPGPPRATLALERALAYLEGHKRNSACL